MRLTGTPSLPFISIVHSLFFFHFFSLHLSGVTASRDLKWWTKGLSGKSEPLPASSAGKVVSLVRLGRSEPGSPTQWHRSPTRGCRIGQEDLPTTCKNGKIQRSNVIDRSHAAEALRRRETRVVPADLAISKIMETAPRPAMDHQHHMNFAASALPLIGQKPVRLLLYFAVLSLIKQINGQINQ